MNLLETVRKGPFTDNKISARNAGQFGAGRRIMAEHAGEGGVVGVPLAPPIAPDPRSSLLAGEIAAAASYRRRAKSATPPAPTPATGVSSRRGATSAGSNLSRRGPRRWRHTSRCWRRRAGRTAPSAVTSPRSAGSIASRGRCRQPRATNAWSSPIRSRASAGRRAYGRTARKRPSLPLT